MVADVQSSQIFPQHAFPPHLLRVAPLHIALFLYGSELDVVVVIRGAARDFGFAEAKVEAVGDGGGGRVDAAAAAAVAALQRRILLVAVGGEFLAQQRAVADSPGEAATGWVDVGSDALRG